MNEGDKRAIEALFPALSNTSFAITSPQSIEYNCFAWAINEFHRRWDPDPWDIYYWPDNIPRLLTLDNLLTAYRTVGFGISHHGTLENGFEKIAIYVNSSGIPTHAARQLESGKWTSKLGDFEDVEHSLEGLEGLAYGKVVAFLKREIVWVSKFSKVVALLRRKISWISKLLSW